jgi:hypothetical protein
MYSLSSIKYIFDEKKKRCFHVSNRGGGCITLPTEEDKKKTLIQGTFKPSLHSSETVI